MKTRFLAIPLLITFALSLVETTAVSDAPRGVAPSKAKAYSADKDGNWKCLDGSKTIKFAAINDDYCDCLDGSDEPGTSACGKGYYYCANAGHRAAYIKTSRVNDGVCDPECCDGSDETDGQIHCPNICKQVGAEARKERERVRAIEKEGSKLLQKYINHGKNAKKELGAKVNKLKTEALTIKQKAETCKDALDKADAALQEQLESTKAEREAARKIQLEPIIEQQYARLSHAKRVRDRLRNALEHLKANSNKNYHDLVVKSTIAGYDEHVEELAKYNADPRPVDPSKVLTADETMLAAMDKTYDLRKEIGGLTFSEWVGDNYDTQLYTGGVKCWNGPDRSVKVVMSCGTKNEIIAVSEPNKCEYLFKLRTPAACRLFDGSESTDENPEPTMPGEISKKHDEL
ncbi:hypothetical protein BGZ52_010460 [Haplosporangium bisporale]|nr:hypothetical protein BGZ52_010460 [Haplosporangium bisporale]